MNNVHKKVLGIISDIADVSIDELSLDYKIDNLSSITFIKVIVSIEEEFEIEFDDNFLSIKYLPTIKSIISHIEKIKFT